MNNLSLSLAMTGLLLAGTTLTPSLLPSPSAGRNVGSSATDKIINPNDTHRRKTVKVLDSFISYVDEGQGNPIVFLHGNPTSSYLWRNVITPMQGKGRCLAPDLIGMGKSGPSGTKTYFVKDHIRYMDAWFEAMNLKNVTLVIHDWGSVIGFDWASRHPDRVKAIAYMEAIVADRQWAEFGPFEQTFRAIRSPQGEELILGQDLFIEQVLPNAILRKLTPEEMEAYRAPFKTRESRLPTLTFPREIPVEGQPADVLQTVQHYAQWLSTSQVPKLYIKADPGTIPPSARALFETLPNQQSVTVKGIHYIQEDAPDEISAAILNFMGK